MSNFTVYSRKQQKFSGRLLALPTSQSLLDNYEQIGGNVLQRGAGSGLAVVEFPAMPDELSLDRRTSYLSQANMVLPDGLHLYQFTNPLEIPFRFKLQGSDPEYCEKDGPATLLAIGARLHSFVLPINTNPSRTGFAATFQFANVQTEASEKKTAAEAESPSTKDPIKAHLTGQEVIRPPVTCILELIRISDQSDRMGIHCRGFVKDVSVKFSGPWLRGAGKQFNVPTSAEYGFTFVHVPSHNNDYSQMRGVATAQKQAFAHEVIDRFYNTVGLNTVLSAQGFDLANPNENQPTANNASSADTRMSSGASGSWADDPNNSAVERSTLERYYREIFLGRFD